MRSLLIMLVVCARIQLGWCGESDEFLVKREEVFEFVQKPVVTREGDKITISFETKAFCDVTIAIENAEGRILRHLVSGVLGPNAPAPLQKNSKKQSVVWDGKDDQDAYTDHKEDRTVRVSLGLKPKFERTLFHSPYKKFGRNQPVMSSAPEGMYVYESDMADNVRLFDHSGTYVQTIYPFPAGKLEKVNGLRWRTTLDGQKVPFKEGSHQVTFLASGYNGGFNPETGFGQYRLKDLHAYDGLPSYEGAASLAIHGTRLALVGFNLTRLATDGSSGGVDFHGGKTGVQVTPHYTWNGPGPMDCMPRSAAFSPDGKFVYLTGYTWYESKDTAGACRCWLHGVMRVNFEEQSAAQVFVGDMKQDEAVAGTGDAQFNCPTSVACDAEGRIYGLCEQPHSDFYT